MCAFFFFQAEDGIRDADVTGVQTCALPILPPLPYGRKSFMTANFEFPKAATVFPTSWTKPGSGWNGSFLCNARTELFTTNYPVYAGRPLASSLISTGNPGIFSAFPPPGRVSWPQLWP